MRRSAAVEKPIQTQNRDLEHRGGRTEKGVKEEKKMLPREDQSEKKDEKDSKRMSAQMFGLL